MRISAVVGSALCALTLGGCANMSPSQQRLLSGGAIGTGAGVGVTLITGGCIACGAVVGGVIGAGAGYVIDMIEK
ncbi:MAG: hypothetical protein EXQ88_01275 [Alphaproteobacteria bacterium]|nr:hypothetical protein [Alphaproteobacteria bacterium]